jgi:glycosyltransferase involved in cell wall biosynthesis
VPKGCGYVKPIVTIGVCVRNAASTIREAMESIMDQDFPHELMEAIFVDDGSKDNTLLTIQGYISKLNIPTKIFCTSWRGLGYARNIVVKEARGKYIIWVDGDMVLSEDYMSQLVELMEQRPEVGIAKGKQALEPGGNLLATLETYSRAASRMVDYNSERAQYKSMGTGGSIYRVKAIRHVGGFDENITGYGEDFDAEYRIRKAGWLLCTTDVQFRDYERGKILWKDLWRRYFQRGYDMYRLSCKRKAMVNFYKMLPPATFLAGLLHSAKIYKLTNKKAAFLLPFQYMFKMTSWCLGFIKAKVNSRRSEAC